ncbi:DUF4238 domain-containing protein [Pseudoalteromonas neustonica]|uniref:DUF4238 domain-containing protein n=1 Tax=Pseudoalteromonas neustonica TaxID=1840331 RepID=UPI0007DB3152|nr:DUF4238 domain-containing protein [Pseudoalteromonas neustonica]
MSKQISKKHHFIPQFYIKGFSNEDNDVFLYDIEYKKVSSSSKKSSQIFYEEHLHTVKKFGQKSLLIEESYSELEGMFSQVVNQMKDWPDDALQEIVKVKEFIKTLILMLSVQYWRNPRNTLAAQEISGRLVELYDQALPTNGEVIPFDRQDVKYFQKKHKDLAVQKFIQFLILPLLTFKFIPEQLKGLRIVKLKDECDFICSDNPVSLDDIDSEFNFIGKAFYPLTKKYAITNIQFKALSELDDFVLSNARKKIIAFSKKRLSGLPQA